MTEDIDKRITRILYILNALNISFERQYTFADLRFVNPLMFDFAIKENSKLVCLIEYQGIQHYEEQKNGMGWFVRNISDPMKKTYCNIKNIPLFEIKYNEDIRRKLFEILTKMHVNFVPSSEIEKV